MLVEIEKYIALFFNILICWMGNGNSTNINKTKEICK